MDMASMATVTPEYLRKRIDAALTFVAASVMENSDGEEA